jgi:hypothetical protein
MMVLLVVAFGALPQMLLFGIIDLLGAAWTVAGLRKAAQSGPTGAAAG